LFEKPNRRVRAEKFHTMQAKMPEDEVQAILHECIIGVIVNSTRVYKE